MTTRARLRIVATAMGGSGAQPHRLQHRSTNASRAGPLRLHRKVAPFHKTREWMQGSAITASQHHSITASQHHGHAHNQPQQFKRHTHTDRHTDRQTHTHIRTYAHTHAYIHTRIHTYTYTRQSRFALPSIDSLCFQPSTTNTAAAAAFLPQWASSLASARHYIWQSQQHPHTICPGA